MVMLTSEQIRAFVEEGFIPMRGAVPRQLAERCRDQLWQETGCDPYDRTTWSKPVIRIQGMGTEPFQAAATTPLLHEAFDQLVGKGSWQPRRGLGTFPIRFPSDQPPGDDGWPLDYSFTGDHKEPRVNLRSRGRALLMLFLFSDVGGDDAPTRIRVGSHLDVPPLLAAAGSQGREWMQLCAEAVAASAHRPQALATGSAGDVFLCHPFLVHAAQPHHGNFPRFIAQPPLELVGLLDLSGTDPSPVEQAVINALPPNARRTY